VLGILCVRRNEEERTVVEAAALVPNIVCVLIRRGECSVFLALLLLVLQLVVLLLVHMLETCVGHSLIGSRKL